MRNIKVFDSIKRFFNANPSEIRYKLIQDSGNGFYCWNGNLYKSDIIRSCIRPKAKAVGKMVAKHIREGIDGLKVNPEPYIKMLLQDPNPYMSGQMLLEKMINQLELNNNAFAFINRDENGYPMEIYSINSSTVEAIYDTNGLLYLRFSLKNGKFITFAYSDIIHLRQDFNENYVFGTSRFDALNPLMDIVSTTDQGIVKAIKNGAVVKWLLKFNSSLRPEDLRKATKEFVDNYLSIDNEVGGAAAADGKYDAKQVDPKDYVPNPMLVDKTLQRIYGLFGTNDKIIQSKYNENEWISYFEAEIEPIAVQLSNEYTRKLFSRRERGFGNSIVFEASNLQYASMTTKLALVQMVDRRALSPNEWRSVFNLAPVEGGDEYIMRLDTASVKETQSNTLNNKKSYKGIKKIKNAKSEKIYAVDFDGTLCKNIYPKIGDPKEEVVNYVKNLKDNGNKLILWTCRTGEELDNAISWCDERGIEFDAINENLSETIEAYGTDPRKISADCYLDDKALNVDDV